MELQARLGSFVMSNLFYISKIILCMVELLAMPLSMLHSGLLFYSTCLDLFYITQILTTLLYV